MVEILITDVLLQAISSLYIFTLCAGAISWKASLQPTAALSTTEVEYIAAIEGVKGVTLVEGSSYRAWCFIRCHYGVLI